MHRSNRLTLWARMAVISATTLGALGVVAVPSPAAAADPRSCGWALQVSPETINAFLPDQAATYWVAALPIPPGGRIKIRGSFPHARYMSLTTYDAQTSAIDGINDQSIDASPGSTNPFLVGADRTAKSRRYVVNVLNEKAPRAARPANTLYTENSDGTKSTKALHLALLALRIYVPDTGSSLAGGVPLPRLTIVGQTGRGVTLPPCPNLLPSTALSATIAGLSNPVPLPPLGLFGTNPPQWRKFTNLVSSAVGLIFANAWTGNVLYPSLVKATDSLLPSGGFFENPDNKYVETTMDSGFGQVLAFRFRAPTTPHTDAGQHVMTSGQLRYWSLCSESPETTGVYGCVYDEQVPVASDGYVTVVVSSAAQRPANATTACGAAWIPAGPIPQTLLLLRDMLPAAGFAQAIQNAQRGTEQQTLGDYYPVGRYYRTSADYERLGCSHSAASR